MLKKVLLMAAVVLLGLPGLAHAQLGRGEISVGYGVAPVTDWIDAYSDKLLDVLDMKDASMDSWGGVSVNYTFRIVGGLGVGATFVYSGNNQRLAGKKISTDYYSIMPHLKMRWLNLRILSLYSRIGVGLTFTESSGEGQSESARQWAFQVSPIGVEIGGKVAAYAEAGIGTMDRLLPVFASAFNGSVQCRGHRHGPAVRSVREGEVLCRFRKDFAPGMRCRRFACERAIVFEREGEEDVADVSICQNLRKERKKQDVEIALLRGPVFSVPIAGAIGCSLSRIPGRFVFGLDFKVKIREDSLVIGDYPQHSDTEREQAEKRPADHAELHEK